MLKNSIFNFKFFRFVQTGLYLDFFFKKIIEIFVKNYLVLTAQFFGEKYVIEYFTKKIIVLLFVFLDYFFCGVSLVFGLINNFSKTSTVEDSSTLSLIFSSGVSCFNVFYFLFLLVLKYFYFINQQLMVTYQN
jgi:hypothetical protein